MARGSSSAPPIVVVAVFAAVLFFMGRAAWQWFSSSEPEPAPSLAEQVEQIPGVTDVSVASEAVPGSGGHRGVESSVTFGDRALADPAATAARLADVTHGWTSSHWTVEGTPSTAEVTYVSSLDPAPFAWWLGAVAALEDGAPEAALACDVRYGSLECDVSGGDATAVREALGSVPVDDVRAWVDATQPDEGEPHGFVLRVDGEPVGGSGR